MPSYSLTCLLIAMWSLVSGLEWIANFGLLKDEGILSWDLLSLRTGRLYRSRSFAIIFSEFGTAILLGVRMTATATLFLSAAFMSPLLALPALAAIVVTSWLLMVRAGFGGDGSDQMGLLVSIGTLILTLGLILDEPTVRFALLNGGQLTLSYFVSGFSKLLSPTWRKGAALVGVMSTHSYGHPIAAKISAGSVHFSAIFCWMVILGEALFPVSLFFSKGLLAVVLSLFLVFHLSNAFFMGLNGFVWSFTAAFPSVFYLSDSLRAAFVRL